MDSDFNVDLTQGRLPWPDGFFESVVSQHFIEHLDLRSELLPLLVEIRRVSAPGAELWLSCPDLAKVCLLAVKGEAKALIEDRRTRFPNWTDDRTDYPSQWIINEIFVQWGQHLNLFDFELLDWALRKCGFIGITRVCEADLLARFTNFPVRGDDFQSIYVRANVPEMAKS